MKTGIYHLYLSITILLLQSRKFTLAYYRCTWVTTENVSPKFDPGEDIEPSPKTRQCYHKDSDIMSSFVEQCTGQKKSVKTCSDSGRWQCSSLVGLCKTLIKVEAPRIQTKPVAYSDNSAVLNANQNCPPSRAHFSLQEMSLAVLVSFISGSIVLTAIVVLIWKCRHAKWESDQSRTERRQREQRAAALHAITQIAKVLGPTTSADNETVFYLNPNYNRTVASDIIDMISENDHIYEEVMLRRMSSCLSRNTQNSGNNNSATTTPTNSRKKPKISKSASLSSIVELAEHLERAERESNASQNDANSNADVKSEDGAIEIEAPSTSDSGIIDDHVEMNVNM